MNLREIIVKLQSIRWGILKKELTIPEIQILHGKFSHLEDEFDGLLRRNKFPDPAEGERLGWKFRKLVKELTSPEVLVTCSKPQSLLYINGEIKKTLKSLIWDLQNHL